MRKPIVQTSIMLKLMIAVLIASAGILIWTASRSYAREIAAPIQAPVVAGVTPTKVPATQPPNPQPTATSVALPVLPPQPVRPTSPLTANPLVGRYGVKWIDISLSKQLLVAYEGNRAVFSTLVSTGVARYPTAAGTFHIYVKLNSQRMVGGTGADHYDLPNVPNVMYFNGGDAIHGAYWHHNFGHPMSHGCVNLPLNNAAWMYNWAPVGTTVVVHW